MTGAILIESLLIIASFHKLLRSGYGPGGFGHGQVLWFVYRMGLNRRF